MRKLLLMYGIGEENRGELFHLPKYNPLVVDFSKRTANQHLRTSLAPSGPTASRSPVMVWLLVNRRGGLKRQRGR